MDSRALDVAIGLAFVFAVTAALSSVLAELVARFLGLRARFLLIGLRELLDTGTSVPTDLGQALDTYGKLLNASSPPVDGPGAPGTPAPPTTDPTNPPAATDPSDPTPRTAAAEATAPATDPTASSGASAVTDPSSTTDSAPATAPTFSATEALLGTPVMRTLGMRGAIDHRSLQISDHPDTTRLAVVAPSPRDPATSAASVSTRAQLRRLPSYVSSRVFATAVLDLVVPNSQGQSTITSMTAAVNTMQGCDPLKQQLQSLLNSTGDSVEEFRTAIENWYDDHMDRVSGWYKRHLARISLAIGAALVVLLNLNAVSLAQTLYFDDDIRQAVAAAAAAEGAQCADSADSVACAKKLQAALEAADSGGLPLGWRTVPECQPGVDGSERCTHVLERWGIWAPDTSVVAGIGSVLLLMIGLLLTMIALVPGAHFWYDLLGKLGSLRASGPKPPESAR